MLLVGEPIQCRALKLCVFQNMTIRLLMDFFAGGLCMTTIYLALQGSLAQTLSYARARPLSRSKCLTVHCLHAIKSKGSLREARNDNHTPHRVCARCRLTVFVSTQSLGFVLAYDGMTVIWSHDVHS